MAMLEVPGAQLFYETHGGGPVLLLVPGASGTGDGFSPILAPLAAHYTVVTYDRRGFSRSALTGSQDDDRRLENEADDVRRLRRLETEADDVRRLIERLGDQPAIVYGFSSGAVLALQVITRHPAVVRTLLAHEPPLATLVPDGPQWLAGAADVRAIYRERGLAEAQRARPVLYPERLRRRPGSAGARPSGRVHAGERHLSHGA